MSIELCRITHTTDHHKATDWFLLLNLKKTPRKLWRHDPVSVVETEKNKQVNT